VSGMRLGCRAAERVIFGRVVVTADKADDNIFGLVAAVSGAAQSVASFALVD